MNTKEIVLPEGWEIDKVENNKIILKESKKELPKTWEECANILSSGIVEYIDDHSGIISIYSSDIIPINDKNILPTGLGKPMLALCQLLVCREVYRQGWKPNWSEGTNKYCIVNHLKTNEIGINGLKNKSLKILRLGVNLKSNLYAIHIFLEKVLVKQSLQRKVSLLLKNQLLLFLRFINLQKLDMVEM